MKRVRPSAIPVFTTVLLLVTAPVFAHPLGNFSVNHYASLDARVEGISLTYVLDIAEVPTFQEVGALERAEMEPHLRTRLAEWVRGLRLSVEDVSVPLTLTTARLECVAGAGGLPTLRVEADLWAGGQALVPSRTGQILHVAYRDMNFPSRVGWKEIIVTGQRVLAASVPAVDRGTNRLHQYPPDVAAPPEVLTAQFRLRASEKVSSSSSPSVGAPSITLDLANCLRSAQAATGQTASGNDRPSGGRPQVGEATVFGALLKRFAEGRFDAKVLLVALTGAVLLGAYHALTPGHGKTILAAYFIGSRGTPGQAVLLGSVVTLTHTSGVFVLGLVTLFASRYVVPERLYPMLSVLSGFMLLAVGLSLFRRRLRGWRETRPDAGSSDHEHVYVSSHTARHEHAQLHEHSHSYEHHDKGHQGHQEESADHDHHVHQYGHRHHVPPGETVRARDLITLGVTGGLLPCPSALIVMLAAISVGQVGFGLILITAFSVGLAGVLTGGGLLMVYARTLVMRFVDRKNDGRTSSRWRGILRPAMHRLPVFSAAAVALLGLVIVIQTIASLGSP